MYGLVFCFFCFQTTLLGVAWKQVFLPAHLGRQPTWPLPCLHGALRKTVPTAAAELEACDRGEGAAVKDTKGTELSCFPFSSRVPGTPHASLSTVRLGCGGGGKERGTGTSPRFGFERCTAEVRPTPPCNSRPATCNHSPSLLRRLLMWCQQEGMQTLPVVQTALVVPLKPPHPHSFLYKCLSL